MKIVSLVPSITELLIEIGLNNELKGITKFCIHPSEICNQIPKIGGTKNLNLELISVIQPDLIIANKEENDKSQIEKLAADFNVLLTDTNTYDEALIMIEKIGEICNRKDKTNALIKDIKAAFDEITYQKQSKKIIYLIWKNPFMAAGKNTFIDSIMQKAGFINCITTERYPVIEPDEIKKINPDYIFLSTEPYPFKESDKLIFNKFPLSKIKIVDGEMFSWYGSRMKKAPNYFKQLWQELM